MSFINLSKLFWKSFVFPGTDETVYIYFLNLVHFSLLNRLILCAFGQCLDGHSQPLPVVLFALGSHISKDIFPHPSFGFEVLMIKPFIRILYKPGAHYSVPLQPYLFAGKDTVFTCPHVVPSPSPGLAGP